MLSIDQYAYTNELRSYHPGEKFAFTILTMVICLAASSIATSLAVLLLMSAAVIWRAGIPCRVYVKYMSVPLFFLLVGVATIAVVVSKESYASLFGFTIGGFKVGVTSQSIRAAVSTLSKSLGAVSCLYFLSLTTPMTDVIYIFRKMKVPALFIELMTLIYRFIFVLMETAEKIYTAQSSRLGYSSVKISFCSLGKLASNLFMKSFYRSQLLFQALSARCYTGGLNVVEPQYVFSYTNLLLIVVLELALVALTLYSGGELL
ncbi:cobalt ECF transporter T component CbiQ [Desulfolucanica intricata]|uniref:cobalt ECF transporter T component CbiQ n=1 Tax=Desulfolucanica intricata TaxID=1285191 RepID=UPI000836F0A1|nr:cobalt ECF transporter T component CbiQ [Desulfolucanica intricata]